MPHNKPKYTLFKNGQYALNGLIEVTKNESSFKLQLLAFVTLQAVLFFLEIELFYKAIMGLVLFVPIMAELINSAVERVVDLVTSDYAVLAKYAKDAGSALVLISLIFTSLVWCFCLLFAFEIL